MFNNEKEEEAKLRFIATLIYGLIGIICGLVILVLILYCYVKSLR
jgi:hypothetical protein